jgi:hypothetical protein
MSRNAFVLRLERAAGEDPDEARPLDDEETPVARVSDEDRLIRLRDDLEERVRGLSPGADASADASADTRRQRRLGRCGAGHGRRGIARAGDFG